MRKYDEGDKRRIFELWMWRNEEAQHNKFQTDIDGLLEHRKKKTNIEWYILPKKKSLLWK